LGLRAVNRTVPLRHIRGGRAFRCRLLRTIPATGPGRGDT
jgi:hypothetical protein